MKNIIYSPEEYYDVFNNKYLKDIRTTIKLANKKRVLNKEYVLFNSDNNIVNAMANVNLATIDAKVSIDIKRILRLPSSLHSKVSMKCVEVENRENFDPFKYAVPKFVHERKDEEVAVKK